MCANHRHTHTEQRTYCAKLTAAFQQSRRPKGTAVTRQVPVCADHRRPHTHQATHILREADCRIPTMPAAQGHCRDPASADRAPARRRQLAVTPYRPPPMRTI